MPGTHSNIRRHLQYRLWIADMNADIIVLRIFDDHIAQLLSKKNSPEVKKVLEDFMKQFSDARNEIDGLKHEMHLVKMKLAAGLRQPDMQGKTETSNNHSGLEQRYKAYRKTFDNLKRDFADFEPEEE